MNHLQLFQDFTLYRAGGSQQGPDLLAKTASVERAWTLDYQRIRVARRLFRDTIYQFGSEEFQLAASNQSIETHYPIFAVAAQYWPAHRSDCSGYVRAVALSLGVHLTGDANQLIDFWNGNAAWQKLGHDSERASAMAAQAYLVVAGKKGTSHGHVVIVVPGRSHGHAMAYWGMLHSVGREDSSMRWAFQAADLPSVEYFAYPVPKLRPQ